MKLKAIKFGLTTAAACALALSGCSGEDGGNTPAGTTGTQNPGDTGSGTGGSTAGSDGSSSGSDGGPVGMGEDPPTFDCANATETLDKKFFEVGGEFNDVMLLEGVSVINGNVDVNRSNYNNLDFLQCITEITGTLTIFGNSFLVDVSALDTLATLGGDFVFTENNAMVVFDGLNNITQIFRSPNPDAGMPGEPEEFFHSVVMNKNAALTRIEGFDSLMFIFGNITIRANPLLLNIDGFKGLVGIGFTLAITNNASLCITSVNCVGAGIENPAPDQIPDSWTTTANCEPIDSKGQPASCYEAC